MPQISVIVPVYMAENFLNRCVDSILNQTYQDFELILVDDGSPDSSGSICDEYVNKDGRVRVLHCKNSGVAASRNHGVAASTAKWICFIDSDDAIHPQMLEMLFGAVVENRVRISMCNADEGASVPDSFGSRNLCAEFRNAQVNEDLLIAIGSSYYYHCVWGKLIDRDIVEKFRFAEGRYYEDTAIVAYWLLEAENVAITDNKLYFYFINPVGISKGARKKKKLYDQLWSQEEQLKLADMLLKTRNYEKFHSFISSRYLLILCAVYFDMKRISSLEAKRIRNTGKQFYKRNKREIQLLPAEKKWVYEMLYPNLMKVYWRFANKGE